MYLTLACVMEVRMIRVKNVVVCEASFRVWLIVKHLRKTERPQSHLGVRADIDYAFGHLAFFQKGIVHLNEFRF